MALNFFRTTDNLITDYLLRFGLVNGPNDKVGTGVDPEEYRPKLTPYLRSFMESDIQASGPYPNVNPRSPNHWIKWSIHYPLPRFVESKDLGDFLFTRILFDDVPAVRRALPTTLQETVIYERLRAGHTLEVMNLLKYPSMMKSDPYVAFATNVFFYNKYKNSELKDAYLIAKDAFKRKIHLSNLHLLINSHMFQTKLVSRKFNDRVHDEYLMDRAMQFFLTSPANIDFPECPIDFSPFEHRGMSRDEFVLMSQENRACFFFHYYSAKYLVRDECPMCNNLTGIEWLGFELLRHVFSFDTIDGIFYVVYDYQKDKLFYTFNDRNRLLLCGDVEQNPGPAHSKMLNESARIKQLEEQVKLLKQLQEKQKRFVQRQIELEKRDRKKNRLAQGRRHAQTLTEVREQVIKDARDTLTSTNTLANMTKVAAVGAMNVIAPGTGTAVASVVTGAKLNDAVNKLNPALDMLQNILKSLSEASESLRDAFSIPKDYDLLNILITLVSIAHCFKEKQLFLMTLHCANLARHLHITLDSLLSLVPDFSGQNVSFGTPPTATNTTTTTTSTPSTSGTNTNTSQPKPVSQASIADFLASIAERKDILPVAAFLSFFSGIFSLMCVGTVPTPSEMLKHFGNIGRAAQGFKAVKDLFTWLFDYLAEIYYTTIYGMTKEEYEFMKSFPRIKQLYAAVAIIEKITKAAIDDSANVSNQVLTVHYELVQYQQEANKSKSRSTAHLLDNLIKRIRDRVSWATSSPARAITIRSEPTTLYLSGLPGVGKSTATQVLKANIYRDYLKKEGISIENCSHTRMARNEFWEGYTGQPIVILDDFGNMKDSVSNPVAEYEELQRMVNTEAYPLRMAELSSKGTSFFTSKVIIASSNQKYPDIVSMVSPGAILRRFHIWAEVSIDPRYGVQAGLDENGKPYYRYDADTAAAHKGISKEELAEDPLMTEHYRFDCYTVKVNKENSSVDVIHIPNQQGLSFDEFWKYFKQEFEKRNDQHVRLANAIRKLAGEEAMEKPPTEAQIMQQFEKVFNAESFIADVANSKAEIFTDADDKKEEDQGTSSLFGSISECFSFKLKEKALWEDFNKSQEECSTFFASWWERIKSVFGKTKSVISGIAEFILSLVSNLAGVTYSYLPAFPSSGLLKGIAGTLLAAGGLWFSGIFSSLHSEKHGWCLFTTKPSDNDMPCEKCSACKIIGYTDGDALKHYVDTTWNPAVRQELLKRGMTRDELEESREMARRAVIKSVKRKPILCLIKNYLRCPDEEITDEDARALLNSTCLIGCDLCEEIDADFDYWKDDAIDYLQGLHSSLTPTAQKVYESQPRAPKPRNFAQKTYETQPRQARSRNFAQKLPNGTIECKTEVQIGATKYAQRDRIQIEQTTQVLLNNSVWVQAVDKNGMCSRSNGVFLVGRTMMTTAHTILNPPCESPVDKLIIQNPYSQVPAITVPLSECKVSQISQMDGSPVDLVLVSFPPVVPNRPRILSKFIDSTAIDLLKEGQLTFSGFFKHENKTIVQEKYSHYFEVSTKATQYWLHEEGKCPITQADCVCPINIGNHIEYDLETAKGTCGALLSISNKLIHTKLIGIHVAGGKGVMAMGVLTTRQLLEAALQAHVDKFHIPRTYLIDGRLPYSHSLVDTTKKTELIELGDCINVGVAPAPACPSQTSLEPSLVHDKVQKHTTKPAYLRPTLIEGKGMIDPMIEGIKKVMGDQTFVDPDILEAAAEDVFQGLGLPKDGKGIVHTYEEAITGVEGNAYKRPINRTTSPGYPYNLTNKSKGKTHWLGNDETYIVDNPELKHDVTKLISDAKQGIRGDAISIATLKDEKRPIAKVEEGKTRVFEACPQHLVIALRQYFLDFAAHVMEHRIKNGIAVGINPYSLEWTKLAHHLQSKGDNMIAGDFSRFDGSLLMQILVKIMEKINDWYNGSEEESLIRATLWEHICNADILVKGEVIRKTHSQPSGNPLTVIINSLFNGIVMRIAFMLLKKEQGLPMVCDYRNYVSEIIYGDDDIKSVRDDIKSWFNQITLTKALASFGLTYTDECKTGVIRPFKRLTEVAFLKRKFAIQPDGTFMAPMDLENVLEITNWIRGKAKIAATVENCDQTVMELSLHDKATYDQWTRKIREELAKVGVNYKIPTWFEQRELYRSNRDQYDRGYFPLF